MKAVNPAVMAPTIAANTIARDSILLASSSVSARSTTSTGPKMILLVNGHSDRGHSNQCAAPRWGRSPIRLTNVRTRRLSSRNRGAAVLGRGDDVSGAPHARDRLPDVSVFHGKDRRQLHFRVCRM